jgi:hypothetical protein
VHGWTTWPSPHASTTVQGAHGASGEAEKLDPASQSTQCASANGEQGTSPFPAGHRVSVHARQTCPSAEYSQKTSVLPALQGRQCASAEAVQGTTSCPGSQARSSAIVHAVHAPCVSCAWLKCVPSGQASHRASSEGVHASASSPSAHETVEHVWHTSPSVENIPSRHGRQDASAEASQSARSWPGSQSRSDSGVHGAQSPSAVEKVPPTQARQNASVSGVHPASSRPAPQSSCASGVQGVQAPLVCASEKRPSGHAEHAASA